MLQPNELNQLIETITFCKDKLSNACSLIYYVDIQ